MRITIAVVLTALGCATGASAQKGQITVRADKVTNQISRHMTGACLEDVNHEVYGGLYSQMIFGESFQEPPPKSNVPGFKAYGPGWMVAGETLFVSPNDGSKLIADAPPFADGEVSVEMLLPEQCFGTAGLVVRVANPEVGVDNLTGYYVALDSKFGLMRLNRHRKSFETLLETPYQFPINQRMTLTVKMAGRKLEVLLDGKSVGTYEDAEHPLPAGTIGLKTLQREVQFRNLRATIDSQTRTFPFQAGPREGDEISRHWSAIRQGSVQGSITLDRAAPFVGKQCQRIAFEGGTGAIGLSNGGLNGWGMNFVKDKPYEGCICVSSEKPVDVYVSFEDAAGSRTYAETRLGVKNDGWQQLDFTMTPDASDAKGRFGIRLKSAGSIGVGYASLQPGGWGRFKDLPVRREIAEAFVAQGITVLRYGGSMVFSDQYRWKKMIGPRHQRPPYTGSFYLYSTNGWGIIDFINFCEAAGFLGIPAFNMGETPQDMADFVEYVNGPADSKWGQRRVQDGHPKPYGLKCIELGNEEAIDENYWRRFKPLAEAIWAKDPAIVPVVGDFSPDLSYKMPLTTYKNILDLAREHDREVWFDLHLLTERPEAIDAKYNMMQGFFKGLREVSPGAKFKVGVFEFNAYVHDLGRALGNAQAISELERLGDDVRVACSANALQPNGQNDNGWDQGLIFFTPTQVWGQPSYYVTQMVSENYLPNCVKAEVTEGGTVLGVTAKASADGKIVQIQVLNPGDQPVQTELRLAGFTPAKAEAKVTELSGRLEEVNDPEHPARVAPQRRSWSHNLTEGRTSYAFPPHSFTIIRFE